MLKRFFALLLTAAMVLPAFVQENRVGAAGYDDRMAQLESVIQKQFHAYADTIDVGGADETVQKQFLNNARAGKDLYTKAGSPLAAVVFNANLYEVAFVKGVSAAIWQMEQFREEKKQIRGGVSWYDYRLSYTYRDTTDYWDDKLEQNVTSGAVVKSSGTDGVSVNINDYDSVVMLIGGSTSNRINIIRGEVTDTEATYKITTKVYDNFNFDGNYEAAEKKGYDTSRAKLLTLLGRLLGYKEFYWETEVSFEVKVPMNSCDHQSGAYHWTYTKKEMTNHVDGEFIANHAEEIIDLKEDGTPYSPYFELEKTIKLDHRKPWVVEFVNRSSGTVALAPTQKITSEYPYIIRSNSTQTNEDGTTTTKRLAAIGRYQITKLTPEESVLFDPVKKPKSAGFYHYRGVDYTEQFTAKYDQTFRLENRVARDGSNMVWLYIDDVEWGPMTDHYLTNTLVKYEKQKSGDTWLNGQDIYINYIGNKSYRVGTGLKSVTIWENGEGGGTRSSMRTVVTAPTCSSRGYTTHICDDCGYSYRDNYVPALPHTEVADSAVEPTCTTSGLTAGTHCSVCNTVLTAQSDIPALGHVEVLQMDESGHWYACQRENCDMIAGQDIHRYDEGSCGDNAKCNVCGYEGGEGCHIPGKWKVKKKATCIEPGLRIATCIACGGQVEEIIEPHGEAVVEIPEQPATCTTNGKTAKIVCSECGKVVQKQKTIKKGHLLTVLCGDENGHWYACEREDCDEIGKVSNHKYDVDSCEETACCEDCGYEKAPGEHIPGKWKVKKKATCIEDGLRTATCTVCKEKLEDVIEAHGEAVVEIPEQPATCTENGKTAKLSCSECGKVVQRQKTIKKGHLLTELCFNETRHWYECEREGCDATGKSSKHQYKNGVCKSCGYEKE